MKWLCIALIFGCATSSGIKGRLVAVSAREIEQASKPKRFALLIGVNNFNDTRWPALKYAASDAELMRKALRDFDDIKMLNANEKTSADNIRAEVKQIANKAQMSNDVVFVFFSTHGTLDRKTKGTPSRYLIANDTKFDEVSTSGISLDWVVDALNKSRSQRRVLVFDTCYSGEGKSAFTGNDWLGAKGQPFIEPIENVSEATVILSATAWGETAREDENVKAGIFTHFFAQAVDSGDANHDGAVTVTEAYDAARTHTYYYTEGRQRPSARMLVVGIDPIVLRGSAQRGGQPWLYGGSDEVQGLEFWLDGKAQGILPKSISVEAGKHRIQMKRKGFIVDQELALTEGQVLGLEQLLPRTLGYGFEVAAGYGGWGFSNSLVSKQWPIFSVSFELQRLGATWLMFRAELRGRFFEGISNDNSALGYSGGVLDASILAGAQWRKNRVHFSAGVKVDLGALFRQFKATNISSDASFVWGVGAEGAAGFYVADHFRASVFVDGQTVMLREDFAVRTAWQFTGGIRLGYFSL